MAYTPPSPSSAVVLSGSAYAPPTLATSIVLGAPEASGTLWANLPIDPPLSLAASVRLVLAPALAATLPAPEIPLTLAASASPVLTVSLAGDLPAPEIPLTLAATIRPDVVGALSASLPGPVPADLPLALSAAGTVGADSAAFAAWLDQPSARRCLLAEIRHAAGTLYASNLGYISGPSDAPANIPYPAWLVGAPTLSESLLGDERPGALDLYNDGALDAELDRAYAGWPLTLYLGDPSWPRADFRPVLAATVNDLSAPSPDKLSFGLRDRRERLKVAISAAKLADDRAVPISLGQPFNVEPPLTDAANLIYTVHSGAVSAISAVRDNGVAVSYTPNAGAGTFALVAAPAGRITADVAGPATYGHDTAGLIEWLARAAGLGDDDLDAANLAAFANAATVGWHGAGDAEAWSAIQALASAAGAAVTFTPEGKLQLYRLTEPASTADRELSADLIEAGSLKVATLEPPYDSVALTYARNWTPQADGLAGSVSTANRDLYSRESQTVTASNALRATWPLAEQPTVDSFFTGATDARTEADRRAALRAVPRRILTATALTPAWTWRLGQTVRVTHPRYGLASGKNFVLIRKTWALSTVRVTLDLWG